MTPLLSKDEIDRLRAPFPLDAHSIREGSKTSNGKLMWFVYVDKPEVESRLNEVFPGEWSSSQPVLYPLGNAVAATIAITIRGISRGNTGEDSNGQEKAKGATTDAFRRAAADWGVAKYLWEMDLKIYTDGYEKGDWKGRDAREKEAFGKFAEWFKKKFQNVTPLNGQQRSPQQALKGNGPDERTITPAKTENPANANVEASEGNPDSVWIYDLPQLMGHVDIVKAYPKFELRANAIKLLYDGGFFANVSDLSAAVKVVLKVVLSGTDKQEAVS